MIERKEDISAEQMNHILYFLTNPPPVLKNFQNDDILEFLKYGTLKHFAKNEVILKTLDYVNSAYLIVEGEVGVWREKNQLMTLSKGSFLGETILFSKGIQMNEVISVEESFHLEFERQNLLKFFRNKPEKLFNIFARNIIQLQQYKLSSKNNQLFNLKKGTSA